MTIVYQTNDKWPGIKFPKLYKVVYGHRDDYDGLPQWQVTYKEYTVNAWLKENCRHSYYHSPGYLPEKFIQFEDDEDAFMFALKWS